MEKRERSEAGPDPALTHAAPRVEAPVPYDPAPPPLPPPEPESDPNDPVCAVCGQKWGQFLHDALTGKYAHSPRCPSEPGVLNVRRFVAFDGKVKAP